MAVTQVFAPSEEKPSYITNQDCPPKLRACHPLKNKPEGTQLKCNDALLSDSLMGSGGGGGRITRYIHALG